MPTSAYGTFDKDRVPLISNMRMKYGDLNVLYVGNSPIWDTYTVAALFSDWFPKIYHISVGPLGGGVDPVEGSAFYRLQQLWTDVGRAIPMIMRIRNQERRGLTERLGRNLNEGQTAGTLIGVSDDAMEVDD